MLSAVPRSAIGKVLAASASMPMSNGLARRAAALFGLVCAALGTAWAEMRPVAVYASDPLGNASTPRVGEPFFAAVRYTVDSPTGRAYTVRFETAYQRMDTGALTFGADSPGTFTAVWGPFPVLMDRPFELSATLDPGRAVRSDDRRNNRIAVRISPISPSEALEFYDARRLSARVSLDLTWSARSAAPDRVVVWMPRPPSGAFQTVTNWIPEAGFAPVSSAPYGEPILSMAMQGPGLAPLHASQSFNATVSGVRANLALLSEARFDGYLGISPELAAWLEPETFVESRHPSIARLAAQLLPADFRTSMSPAEAAEALYRGVLARSSYSSRPGLKPSAYTTLRARKGDCGGLSSLVVALCRASGIPARTVSGFLVGGNRWHVWAEFLVPEFGWIPADPAFAEGRLRSGSEPVYFGVIPEMNSRVAVSYGFDRAVGGLSLPQLQSPAAFWFGTGVRLGSMSVSSDLALVDAP